MTIQADTYIEQALSIAQAQPTGPDIRNAMSALLGISVEEAELVCVSIMRGLNENESTGGGWTKARICKLMVSSFLAGAMCAQDAVLEES